MKKYSNSSAGLLMSLAMSWTPFHLGLLAAAESSYVPHFWDYRFMPMGVFWADFHDGGWVRNVKEEQYRSMLEETCCVLYFSCVFNREVTLVWFRGGRKIGEDRFCGARWRTFWESCRFPRKVWSSVVSSWLGRSIYGAELSTEGCDDSARKLLDRKRRTR